MKKVIYIPEIDTSDIPLAKRKTKGIDDWGDQKTIFIRVKKIDTTIYSKNTSFGIYLGQMQKRYCVGVRNEKDDNISKMETYESISELKHNWRLD